MVDQSFFSFLLIIFHSMSYVHLNPLRKIAQHTNNNDDDDDDDDNDDDDSLR